MENKEKILTTYNYFFKELYQKEIIKLNSAELYQIQKFIKQFPQLDLNFLFNYFSFSFNYWNSKNIVQEFHIKWILGHRSLERWKNKQDNWQYWTQIFLSKNPNLNIIKLEKLLFPERKQSKIDFLKIRREEEYLKTILLNQPNGLYYCIQVTTLINPLSEICQTCNFQQNCKERLLELYPNIYQERYPDEI